MDSERDARRSARLHAVTFRERSLESVPLVFLHGFTGSSSSWSETVRALSSRLPGSALPGLVGIELPGHHPDSPVARRGSFEEALARVARRLLELRLVPAHVVGYSMGARVALGLACTHPATTARVTLVSGHPGLHAESERRLRRDEDAHWCRTLRRDGIEAFVASWAGRPIFASQANLADNVRRKQNDDRRRHEPEALARALEQLGLGVMPDYRSRLEHVRVPMAFIAGARDEKFLALAADCAERAPIATWKSLPGCGHNPLIEAPERLAAVIIEEIDP